MSQGLQTALIGAAGAFVAQFVIWAPELEEGHWPARLRQPAALLAAVMWILVAGFVAWLEAPLAKIPAFQVGLSIKVILYQLGKSVPRDLRSGESR